MKERPMIPYSTIVLDPPWKESGGGKIKRGADRHYPLMSTRDIISLLTVDVLDSAYEKPAKVRPDGLPFAVADDAHCYLWVTNNFLEDGLRVLAAMGFRYVTHRSWGKATPIIFTVVKDSAGCEVWLPLDAFPDAVGRVETLWKPQKPGLGQYFRGSHELVLFGVRGQGYDACRQVNPTTGKKPFIPTLLLAPRGRHSAKPDQFYLDVEARSKGPYLELFAREARDGWTNWGPHEGLNG